VSSSREAAPDHSPPRAHDVPEGGDGAAPGGDEDLFFLEDEPADAAGAAAPASEAVEPWIVVVADDEEDIHAVTEMALRGFVYDGRPLRLVHAYSGAQAVEAVAAHPRVAAILLDVVMENEKAGLDAVVAIRETVGNDNVRIVLRTGQPGVAPEATVITQYQIDYYVEKTEITARRLYALMHTCLRTFSLIEAISANRRSLEEMLDATASLFRLQSFNQFTCAVLAQLQALYGMGRDGLYGSTDRRSGGRAATIATTDTGEALRIVAGTGEFETAVGRTIDQVMPSDQAAQARSMLAEGRCGPLGDGHALTWRSAVGRDKLLYLAGYSPPGEMQRQLLEIFNRNVGVAFDNIHLQDAVETTSREIAWRLGESIEFRSQETGNHVRRVGALAGMLARRVGIDEARSSVIEAAAPLHDIGKVSIPDAILNKPGKLDPAERTVMEAHCVIGHRILAGSETAVLRTAAVIALDHHERWDGEGYPNRKAGADIPREARIVSVADVFDALGSARPYKAAWEPERIKALFLEQRGRQFDPEVVDALMAVFDDAIALRRRMPD